MIENDCRLRECARQIGKIVELRLEHPSVEGKSQRSEGGTSLAKALVQKQFSWPARGEGLECRVVAPGRPVADAAQPAVGNRDVPLEHALDARAQPQICKADDAGDAPRRPIFSRRAHCRDAADKLGLPQGLEFLRSVSAVHLAGLPVARRADVMTAADIGEEVRKQIAIVRAVPQMMMGIDDRQLGLDDCLVALVEPVLPNRGLHRRHCWRDRRCRLLSESAA